MKMLTIVIVMFVLSGFSPVWATSLTVAELAVTTKVSKGKPIDSVHRISHRSVKALFCYSRTASKSSEHTTIKHVWQRDGKIVKEAVMAIKAKQWRAYSTMPVGRSSVGKWQVDVLDADGTKLKTVEFLIN